MSGIGNRILQVPTSEAGFTLIELLVVLAIAGMIAGIGFPRVETIIGHMENRAATAAVVLSLRETRAAALRFDKPASFSATRDGRSFSGSEAGDRPLADAVRVRMPQGSISFYGDGSSNGGTVDVVSPSEIQRIAVDADTGAIAGVRR